MCFASAFPCFHQSWERLLANSLFARTYTVFSTVWYPPASGRRPDAAAFSRAPLSSPGSGFAAGAAARHPYDSGALVLRLSSLSLTASLHRVWSGECISRPRLRRSWRSRHRPPLRHTGLGLTALPSVAAPRPAPSALAAPPRAPSALAAPPRPPILLSALSALPARAGAGPMMANRLSSS